MPKYLVEVKYTLDGIKGVKAEGGSARVAAAKAVIEEQGGKVEAFYFCFGDNDAYVLVDMPDNVSAASVGLIVSAAGGVTTRTIVLLSAEEIDAAAKRKTLYRPPGG
jgi:uncharacterized protein with GYD domain